LSKRILISGISGFVGGYLARELLKQGHEVFGLIRKRSDSSKPKLLKELGIYDDIQFVHSDISELSNLLSAISYSSPDWMFHLAAQSFVPRSFYDPLGTFQYNCLGTQNVLEALRLKDVNTRLVFAGSSEEYGLQFIDEIHFNQMEKKYGKDSLDPRPDSFPELPINEKNYLRPMSPYATSKIFGDFATRNYHSTFGMNNVVSRAFNHEGAGRGHDFVTSSIVRQIAGIHLKERDYMKIGDVTTFRDWSHIEDIVNGYILLADKANAGSLYVQGSGRSHSVLSYILYTIATLGYEVKAVTNFKGDKKIIDPLDESQIKIGNTCVKSNKIDKMILDKELKFGLEDEGVEILTDKIKFVIKFDSKLFRPSDVPLLLSDISKISQLGFKPQREITDIVKDQLDYYLDPIHRNNILESR
jgi:GDPmannose 4,6-dehydratase